MVVLNNMTDDIAFANMLLAKIAANVGRARRYWHDRAELKVRDGAATSFFFDVFELGLARRKLLQASGAKDRLLANRIIDSNGFEYRQKQTVLVK
jgi:hypothetical protein